MEKMDLSLDDIVRMKKTVKVKKSPGNGNNNGVKKHDFKRNRGNSKSSTKTVAAAVSAASSGQVQLVRRTAPPPPPPSAPTNKILVQNLASSVTADDVNELFSQEGVQLACYPVFHYNGNGEPLGSAEVTFQRKIDAQKAMKKYNGLSLDDKVMRIVAVVNVAGGIANRIGHPVNQNGGNAMNGGNNGNGGGNQQRPPHSNRLVGFAWMKGFNNGQGQGNGRQWNNQGRNQGQGQNKGQQGQQNKQGKWDDKVPSASELDAELDRYIRNKKVGAGGGGKSGGGKNGLKKEESLPDAADLDSEMDSYMEQHPGNLV